MSKSMMTRQDFMDQASELLENGVISIRDLQSLISARNLKLARAKEEQKRIDREKEEQKRIEREKVDMMKQKEKKRKEGETLVTKSQEVREFEVVQRNVKKEGTKKKQVYRPPAHRIQEAKAVSADFSPRFPRSNAYYTQTVQRQHQRIDPYRKYVGTVSQISGYVVCKEVGAQISLDGDTIYNTCLRTGDEVEFMLSKSGRNFVANGVNLV